MSFFDDLVSQYRALPDDATEKERALLEREIARVAVETVLRNGGDKRKFLAEHLGVSGRHLDDHSAILGLGDAADKLWTRCEDDMTVGTAVILARQATARAAQAGIDLADAVARELADYDARPFVARVPGTSKLIRKQSAAAIPRAVPTPAPVTRRATKDADVPFRTALRTLVSTYVSERLAGLDDMLVEDTWRALDVDLRSCLDLHLVKVDRLRRSQRQRAQVVNRRRLADAFRALNLEPPRAGAPIDLAAVKRQFRRLVGKYHPDRSGTPSTQALYQQVVEASDIIEEYCAQQSALGANT